MSNFIRLATADDSESILKIYAPYVLNTAISFEIDVPSVADFRKRIENICLQYPYLVYGVDGEIAAYAYASKQRDRAAYSYNVEVSIYALPEYHGQGIAKKLYSCLFEILTEQGYCNAYAGYVESNTKSMRFHEKFGFRPVGIYRKTGYKFGQWHDVVWLEKAINQHKEDPDPVIHIVDISTVFLENAFNEYL